MANDVATLAPALYATSVPTWCRGARRSALRPACAMPNWSPRSEEPVPVTAFITSIGRSTPQGAAASAWSGQSPAGSWWRCLIGLGSLRQPERGRCHQLTALTERCPSAILRPRWTRHGLPRLADHLAITVRARGLIGPTTPRPLIT
jgi:hypothetical protein